MTDCVHGCEFTGEHRTACDGTGCRGCLPKPGVPYWCEGCRWRIGDQVAALPGLAHDIAARRDGRTAPTSRTERRGVNRDPASPSPAYDGFDEVVQWACAWEDVFRRLLHQSPPARASWDADRGRALGDACRHLHTHLRPVLSADPWASIDFGRELGDLVGRLVRGAGVDHLVHHLPLPCLNPRCDRLALVRHDGSETVECRACGTRWTWDDYDRLAGAYAHIQQKETTP